MMGSSSWHPQVYLFKPKMKPRSPQHSQSMAKPQSKHKQHHGHSGLKTGSSRTGGAPPGTLSVHRTRLGSLHSNVSKCMGERKEEEKWSSGLGGAPQAVLKPLALEESPKVPRLAVSGEEESSPPAAPNHKVRARQSGYLTSSVEENGKHNLNCS